MTDYDPIQIDEVLFMWLFPVLFYLHLSSHSFFLKIQLKHLHLAARKVVCRYTRACQVFLTVLLLGSVGLSGAKRGQMIPLCSDAE